MDVQGAREADPDLIARVLGLAVEVHRGLGPGLLEAAYEAALCFELDRALIPYERQVEVPVLYKGRDLGSGFRADLVVDGQLLLELKCLRRLDPVHISQVITYLRLLRIRRGFILNFYGQLMRAGIHRVSS